MGRMSAFIVGCGAIYFGLIFEGMNVSYLAGLTFALAAAANLPALLMALFWSKTTGRAVVCSMLTGLVGFLCSYSDLSGDVRSLWPPLQLMRPLLSTIRPW